MLKSIERSVCDPLTLAVVERLLAMVYSAIKIAAPVKFKVGNSVRKYKMVFEKGYTSNWTTEVFKIVKIQHTKMHIINATL